MIVEDLDTFLFEFDVLWRSYDYTLDSKKLKLFPTTLKGVALRWFMGLGSATICTWGDMKYTFQSIYQDYCWTMYLREEIFRMTQKEEENLEDYVERLDQNLQRFKHSDLDSKFLNTILIRGMRDDFLDSLNLLGKGDMSQGSFNEIIKLCLSYSRGSSSGKSMVRDASIRIQIYINGGVPRAEIGNMFENLETDLLSTLSTQIMMAQEKKAQDEVDTNLAVFCLKSTEKHTLKECRVNTINFHNNFDLEYSIGYCSELPRLKAVLK